MAASVMLNSFLANDDFCRLFITFANSLDADQDRLNVGPDLVRTCSTLIVFLKEFFEKVFVYEKSQHTSIKGRKITQHAKS